MLILGTGSYLPQRILNNTDFSAMGLDTSDEWIFQRTGIRQRRIAEDSQAASDLGLIASRNALEMAGIRAEDIDLIIFATITPDTCCPAAANWLQGKLETPRAKTFDITAACSGFIFALDVAEKYLAAGACDHALVVASEIMSRTLDWEDRSSCILWGDGAGAVVVGRGDRGHRILSTHIHTDGASGQNLLLPGGGSRTTPISHRSVNEKRHFLTMIEANMSFRVAVRRFAESIREATSANGMKVTDIDWIIPHQANTRIFLTLSKSMGIPMERFYLTIHKYGNISSASCAIALDEAVRTGTVKKGDHICMPVFGGGLTWGAAMIRW